MSMDEVVWHRVRVYYEDTDAGGVVYYANYLRFMERARTEWLRAHGTTTVELGRTAEVLFAVRRCRVDFVRPALLDDELQVGAQVRSWRRAGLTFFQEVRRDGLVLCTAEVELACVDARQFRPCALPPALSSKLNSGSVV